MPRKAFDIGATTKERRSQGSLSQHQVAEDWRDHGRVVEDWYLYRGTCTAGHLNILPVRMVGLPGRDNDAQLGTTRINSCAKCGAPVLLRWDDETAPTTGQGPGR